MTFLLKIAIILVMLISQYVKLTVLPFGTTPKTVGFRTLLEIQSSVLACKQTDTDFVYYNQCKAYLQARLQGSRSRLLRERFAESKASAKHRLDKGGSQRSIIYVLLIFEKSKINPCCLKVCARFQKQRKNRAEKHRTNPV